MYESFRVKNYRCFADLSIEPLARVNLIAGKNNVGKTALLEALLLYCEHNNPTVVSDVNGYRGFLEVAPRESLWGLFREFNPKNRIEILVRDTYQRQHSLAITVHERGTVVQSRRGEEEDEPKHLDLFESNDRLQEEPARVPELEVHYLYMPPEGKTLKYKAVADRFFLRSRGIGFKAPRAVFLSATRRVGTATLAQRFSDLVEFKEESSVVETLNIIEPRLKGLKVLQKGRNPLIYGDLGMDRLMPLPFLGDGMARILSLALGVPPAKDAALLVDEFENGLHYSVVKDVWKAIATAVRRFNVQLFATTHSEECIRSAHEAFSESETYDFRFHRLDYVDNTIKAVTYDQEALEFALKSGWEVR